MVEVTHHRMLMTRGSDPLSALPTALPLRVTMDRPRRMLPAALLMMEVTHRGMLMIRGLDPLTMDRPRRMLPAAGRDLLVVVLLRRMLRMLAVLLTARADRPPRRHHTRRANWVMSSASKRERAPVIISKPAR